MKIPFSWNLMSISNDWKQAGTVLLGCFLLGGCELIDYHPYDVRIEGPTDIHTTQIAEIEERLQGRKHFRFVMISDTQRWYDETEDAVAAINRMDSVDFVIHGGDQADFGMTQEFLWMRDIMNGLRVPYVCVLGNHDCLGNGVETFETVYGALNFAFTAGNVRFICLQTNALEYVDPLAVPNFGFLEQELSQLPPSVERTVVVMHAPPYSDQFNNNLAKVFQMYIRKFPNLQFCLHGHGHKFQAVDLFGDGVVYYECPNIQKRSFLVFTMNDTGYDYRLEEF